MPEAVPQELLLWSVVLLGPLAVLTAMLSALLERSGPIRLRHWAEEAGGSLRKLFEGPARFGVFRYLLSLLSRITPIVLFMLLAALLARWQRAWPGLWALGAVILLVAATEAVNRLLVGKDPERGLRVLTRVYRVALWLLSPLVALLVHFVPSSAFERHDENEEGEASDEEIEAFIDVGTREGILEPEEGEWLWGIVGFGDTQARSVMTPRIDMVCAPLGTSIDALAERFIESGHTRIPVFEDAIDHIVGILHIRDVLRAVRSPEPLEVSELLKPPLFVPETKPLRELLKELQARFQQVAIVVDEYGGTAGLVTVEDLLEEIVGEIMDEHEALAAELEPLGNGAYRLDGRAHIELLDELYQVEIEDPEYETVAGLIFSELGHVPQVGETVETHGLRFTVEVVEDRRIKTVRVERINGEEESREAEALMPKSGTVALVGRPNAGKSTLMNRLLEEKLAIVSDKPQTTRHRIVGILTGERGQMVFYDTPGIHKPLHRLNRQMMRYALDAMNDADVVCLLVDVSQKFGSGDAYVLELAGKAEGPRVLILNKADRVKKPEILPVIERYAKTGLFQEIVPVSALTGDNCDRLVEVLWNLLPEGEPLFDPELLTIHPERFLAAERIREKVLELTTEELPFSTAVAIERWEEDEEKDLVRIYASILVDRPGQKKIVVGRQGQMIKAIGTAARHDLEGYLGRRVYLDLNVRLEPGWRENKAVLAALDRDVDLEY